MSSEQEVRLANSAQGGRHKEINQGKDLHSQQIPLRLGRASRARHGESHDVKVRPWPVLKPWRESLVFPSPPSLVLQLSVHVRYLTRPGATSSTKTPQSSCLKGRPFR